MKRLIFLLLSSALFLLLAPNIFSEITGSPGGKTDSPSDIANCTQCHNGSINTGSASLLSIASDIPTHGYTPGQTYSIVVQISETSINRFGFEITCEEGNFGSQKTGAFGISDPSNTKLTNNNNAVTHTQAGTIGSGSKVWSMNWTAPQSGVSGGVVFYLSAMASNNNGNNNGDQVYTTTRFFSEGTSSIIDKQNVITAFLNPASKDIMINSTNKIYIHSLNLYDLSGKEVYTKNDVSLPTILNVDFLSSGTYLVNMQEETGTIITKKIIVP